MLTTVLEGPRQCGKTTQLIDLAEVNWACGNMSLILCHRTASRDLIRERCLNIPERNILSVQEFQFPCGGPSPNDWMTPGDFAMGLDLFMNDCDYYQAAHPERYNSIINASWRSITMTRCVGEDAAHVQE